MRVVNGARISGAEFLPLQSRTDLNEKRIKVVRKQIGHTPVFCRWFYERLGVREKRGYPEVAFTPK